MVVITWRYRMRQPEMRKIKRKYNTHMRHLRNYRVNYRVKPLLTNKRFRRARLKDMYRRAQRKRFYYKQYIENVRAYRKVKHLNSYTNSIMLFLDLINQNLATESPIMQKRTFSYI